MHPVVLAFLVVFGLMVLWLIRLGVKVGPRRLSETDLRRSLPVYRVTTDEPGEGWAELGKKTTARGLDLRFDHDDDPWARAVMPVPEEIRAEARSVGNNVTVRLAPDFTEEHVHTQGWVFRISLRGTGGVVGKEVRLQMNVGKDGRPYGGVLENDDDDDAAVGDWIEVAWAEVLEAPGRG